MGIPIASQFEKGGPSVLKGKAPQPPEESNSVEVTIRPPDFEEKLKDFKFKIRIVTFLNEAAWFHGPGDYWAGHDKAFER